MHDGQLDLFALNDLLNDLRQGVNGIQETIGSIKADTATQVTRVDKLEGWRREVEKAGAFADGLTAGRSKIFGVLDRTIVLAIGLGGLTLGILAALAR